jgi:sec-independent protein translocase protein TatB
MLDVGFSEILLTSAIALVVLGPERLPKVARQVGNWVGRARVMARQLTEQLEREVNAEELLKMETKTAGAKQQGSAVSSAPSAFDTSYTPNAAQAPAENPPADAPTADTAAAPASAAAGMFTPDTAATVQGADWHASPPENKSANE